AQQSRAAGRNGGQQRKNPNGQQPSQQGQQGQQGQSQQGQAQQQSASGQQGGQGQEGQQGGQGQGQQQGGQQAGGGGNPNGGGQMNGPRQGGSFANGGGYGNVWNGGGNVDNPGPNRDLNNQDIRTPQQAEALYNQIERQLGQLRPDVQGDPQLTRQYQDLVNRTQALDPSKWGGQDSELAQRIASQTMNQLDELELLLRKKAEGVDGSVRSPSPSTVAPGYGNAW